MPLQNYSGGTITTANYVTLPSVQVIPGGLAYCQAVSDNTSLVTTSISAAGTLSLTYLPNQTGTAHITVTATDLGGHAVSTMFAVAVSPRFTASLATPFAAARSAASAAGSFPASFRSFK